MHIKITHQHIKQAEDADDAILMALWIDKYKGILLCSDNVTFYHYDGKSTSYFLPDQLMSWRTKKMQPLQCQY